MRRTASLPGAFAKTKKEEKTMNAMKRFLVLSVTALMVCPVWLAGQSKAGDRIPASALFYHFVGRFLLNPSNGTGQVVGYFTDLEGIAGPLFSGTPSEATAFFTFRSDVFSSQSFPTNIDMTLSLGSPGTFSMYLNSAPKGDWSKPDSFSSGQVVATFQRTAVSIFSVGPVNTNIFSAKLVSSADFTFQGKSYNFGRIVPNGITDYHIGSNTVALSGSPDFPLALAFAGSAVAVGSKLSALGPSAK
jgi:hypothetical protein